MFRPHGTSPATGDFNGDNRDDILWRNDNGMISEWLGAANGGFIDNVANASTHVPTQWHIAGTGDFNGDNRDDILWRHDDGRITNWLGLANGGFADNAANGSTAVPTAWRVASIGDYNGDNRDDILWRHDDGAADRLARPCQRRLCRQCRQRLDLGPDPVAGRGGYAGLS